MIDVKKFREDPKPYDESARLRGLKIDVGHLVELDGQYVSLLAETEALKSKLNVKGKPSEAELADLQKVKAEFDQKDAELKKLATERQELLEQVPNLLAPETPEGGEESNKSVKTWGEPTKFEFEPKSHVEIAEARGWLDFERGAKVAGAKFYYTKGALAKLELALTRLILDVLEPVGFELMFVPHMVTGRVAAGAGFLPRGEEHQIYKIEGEDLNLIATAEIPLTGYHADEILKSDDLPKLYVGLSPCYRLEAGAYGKYSKGLYRVHQFNKLEMYVFCRPEEAEEWHAKMVELEEAICQKLEIPYRIVRTAAGDLGAPAYKKFDVEYWNPVEKDYRELTSCSNVTDFQARRLNVRYRKDGATDFVYTLNGTAAAFSRLPIALLENHQTADGGVRLPAELAKYYGSEEL